ncbi:MAG: hypothetical protein OQK78_07535 [Gammaproteobacteria bacterium]|nr:hypothetical protein [Gammaproteobacteria bacterium]
MSSIKPELGAWYQDIENRYFEVVALDDDTGLIEVQFFDGAIDEIDTETWEDLEVKASVEPEDMRGAFDDLEKDDLGDTEAVLHPGQHESIDAEIDQLEQMEK